MRQRMAGLCVLMAAFFLPAGVTPAFAQDDPVLVSANYDVVYHEFAAAGQAPSRPADVVYIPTAPDVVAAMLEMAKIRKDDVVYDLGAGDGRIVIAAVKEFGARRGVGVEIDPVRVAEAIANARQAGVADRVQFLQGDALEADIRQATVVTLFMSPAINLKLRPKLMAQLKPGSRVVSHAFDMGDWKPTDARTIRGRMVYLWTIEAGR